MKRKTKRNEAWEEFLKLNKMVDRNWYTFLEGARKIGVAPYRQEQPIDPDTFVYKNICLHVVYGIQSIKLKDGVTYNVPHEFEVLENKITAEDIKELKLVLCKLTKNLDFTDKAKMLGNEMQELDSKQVKGMSEEDIADYELGKEFKEKWKNEVVELNEQDKLFIGDVGLAMLKMANPAPVPIPANENYKIIYLASPYTHENKHTRANRAEEVTKVAAELMADGYLVYSPIALGHQMCIHNEKLANLPSEAWQEWCYHLFGACSEMWVLCLPDWEKSIGLEKELEWAGDLFMPVRFIDTKLNQLGDEWQKAMTRYLEGKKNG